MTVAAKIVSFLSATSHPGVERVGVIGWLRTLVFEALGVAHRIVELGSDLVKQVIEARDGVGGNPHPAMRIHGHVHNESSPVKTGWIGGYSSILRSTIFFIIVDE